uniref:TBC1 domain family member 1-like isoform X2 n=1 Tax=Jaculus jaculus TaxID=51337 RepID=UPI001E1B1DAE|nr:TBC1 domain family member 1-like isoform X2 [Jaculus jaculus]
MSPLFSWVAKIGQSEVYLISPDTKKVALEKSFKEIFFCSHVDEIMMTLKQVFTVAAVQQTTKAPAQLCEDCPLQSLHKLCERIEVTLSS